LPFFWLGQSKVLHLPRIKIYLFMKKTLFAVAMLALVSCGGSSETTPVVDSTVVVDSIAVDSASVGDATQNAGNIQATGEATQITDGAQTTDDKHNESVAPIK
jgi:uncharacterized protein YcfL